MLTHGSLFTGIGGFDLAAERCGAKTAWQVEWDKNAVKVLETHFSAVRRYGDIQKLNVGELESVDLITAGFPCQDLSIAGKRKGLKGERSGLFWEIIRIAAALQPKWLLLENVPGLLSSDGGRDFAVVLAALDECGYGLAWRVCNSRFWGVPQRRRRVFLVGYFGAPCPPEILFESEGGGRDITAGGEARADIAYALRARPSHSGDKGDGGINQTLVINALQFSGGPDDNDAQAGRLVTFGGKNLIRRLTPLECERVQGFPDNWTVCLSDTRRYKALGNAVTVPVAEWIGRRIVEYEK